MVLFESRAFNTTSSAVDEFDLWPPSFIQQLGYAELCWAMLGSWQLIVQESHGLLPLSA